MCSKWVMFVMLLWICWMYKQATDCWQVCEVKWRRVGCGLYWTVSALVVINIHMSDSDRGTQTLFSDMSHCFLQKFGKRTLGVCQKGSGRHLNNCCAWCCVDRGKPDLTLLLLHQKPTLAASQEGINYTLTHSQFWQTQWVQHKQTVVSIHSCRWIKQHQSLSMPLISPFVSAASLCPECADRLYCAVQYQETRIHPITSPRRSNCHKTLHYHLTLSLANG